jgi:hypothetical protein
MVSSARVLFGTAVIAACTGIPTALASGIVNCRGLNNNITYPNIADAVLTMSGSLWVLNLWEHDQLLAHSPPSADGKVPMGWKIERVDALGKPDHIVIGLLAMSCTLDGVSVLFLPPPATATGPASTYQK